MSGILFFIFASCELLTCPITDEIICTEDWSSNIWVELCDLKTKLLQGNRIVFEVWSTCLYMLLNTKTISAASDLNGCRLFPFLLISKVKKYKKTSAFNKISIQFDLLRTNIILFFSLIYPRVFPKVYDKSLMHVTWSSKKCKMSWNDELKTFISGIQIQYFYANPCEE